ncbi:hypothetical protein HY450_03180 [Candidatus Pacearchaeota archaeon]|nr:hypothetical protein [Candidatus Pacearchaeota archaeon]
MTKDFECSQECNASILEMRDLSNTSTSEVQLIDADLFTHRKRYRRGSNWLKIS